MAESIATVRALNVTEAPKYANPVAVFVGGTSGVGQGMAEAFAKMTQGRATIVIVGRNKGAAESIISKLPKADGVAAHQFVSCDATLMRNIEAASKEILSTHSKINFLVLSSGYFSSNGLEETDEGIDKKIALNYYARWKFIHELLPALKDAKASGEDAKVFSVLGAGKGGPVDANDFLVNNPYALMKASRATTTYNDLMVEEWAERNPGLTFIHAFPGTVKTNFINSAQSTVIWILSPIINAILWAIATSPADCAEYMWHSIFTHTDGAFRTGANGKDVPQPRQFGSADDQKKLWEHTVATVAKAPAPSVQPASSA